MHGKKQKRKNDKLAIWDATRIKLVFEAGEDADIEICKKADVVSVSEISDIAFRYCSRDGTIHGYIIKEIDCGPISCDKCY